MSKSKNQKNDIINSLEIQAKKLAMLLADSNMPVDIKEAWLALLPEMSIKQIDQLLHVFEIEFLNKGTRDIDDEFIKKAKEIIRQHDVKQEEIDKTFINNVKSIVE